MKGQYVGTYLYSPDTANPKLFPIPEYGKFSALKLKLELKSFKETIQWLQLEKKKINRG